VVMVRGSATIVTGSKIEPAGEIEFKTFKPFKTFKTF
jgi:hypothetical protein